MTKAGEEIGDTADRDVEETKDSSPTHDEQDPAKKPTAPQTRRMVTGAELEASFGQWRDERQARRDARTPEDDARTLRRGLSVIIGAAILALVIFCATTSNSFESARSANDSQIAALEQQVSAAQAVPADTDLPARMRELAGAAAADAQKVRDAQQAYARLHHRSSIQPGSNNGAPNQAMKATAAHRRILAPLFSRDSWLVEGEDAYTWQNVVSYDVDDQIDPRFAWYTRYDGWDAADPETYTWEVETVMPVLDSLDTGGTGGMTDQARVIWLCRDTGSGQVLAWASATYIYDGKNGVFDNLDVVTTAGGAKQDSPGGPKPDGSDVPELNGLDVQLNDEDEEGGN